MVVVSAEDAGPVTLVNGFATWNCASQERRLADVILPVSISCIKDLNLVERDTTERENPVVLEQGESGSPCAITLCCAPQHPALLTSLLVISEARTMEVYSTNGDYCGTCRGERDGHTQNNSLVTGNFYSEGLVQSLGAGLGLGPSINMQQVQSMVEEMGKGLSPGAQSLMDMVQFQQRNQATALGGLFPLLMGSGALSALTRCTNGPQPLAPTLQNGHHTAEECDPASPTQTQPTDQDTTSGHARLAELMSPLLKGLASGQSVALGPDVLPMLQSVCCQVTQLRIGDTASAAANTANNSHHPAEAVRKTPHGLGEEGQRLEQAMERGLDEMERRLKEHIDQRLDVLEQRLERVLLSALPLLSLGGQGCETPTAAAVPPEQNQAQNQT
ncbi:ATPase PAAT [Aplochiton taeniatus]